MKIPNYDRVKKKSSDRKSITSFLPEDFRLLVCGHLSLR